MILSLLLFITTSVFPPLATPYHPVSTTNEEAQAAFDRGLCAVYAFNYDEAFRSFEKASIADPQLAMAYWGMALALDELYKPERYKKAYVYIEQAKVLAEGATANEQAYIHALSIKLIDDPKPDLKKLQVLYKDAMQKVWSEYPDDPDAAAVYADSMMDVIHWNPYDKKGNPLPEEEEITSVLESLLDRFPLHLGGNHYYIHAVEGGNHPERGLMSATRLDEIGQEWGHLLHTSSHIYMRVGSYDKTIAANIKAIASDKEYIKKYGLKGVYPIPYLCHNLSFLSMAYLWSEQREKALQTAAEMEAFLEPHIAEFPKMESDLYTTLFVYLYFNEWAHILEVKQPAPSLKKVTTFWHFARAMAFLHLGKKEEAEKEKEAFEATKGENETFKLASLVLRSAFKKQEGDTDASLAFLREAVSVYDGLFYLNWYCQARQLLGEELLALHRPEEAEHVFREALYHFPRNGRSLRGLLEALRMQTKATYWVERETREALRLKD